MMNIKFDREVMKWFDLLFESHKDIFSVNNFICKIENKVENSTKNIYGNKIVSLGKNSTNYWKLEFNLSDSYILRLSKNIHPLFDEYIYEEFTLYRDDKIYSVLNKFIIRVFNAVTEYVYNPIEDLYYLNYQREFVRKCDNLVFGKMIEIDYDVYIVANDVDDIDFYNKEKNIRLNLRFNSMDGEDLLDSILDLRKSIIMNV